MARHARIESSSGIEHVMLRGVGKQTIFRNDADRRKFLECVVNAREKAGFTLHAYCLMGNHVHLLIQKGKESVGESVKRFAISYAYYFNKRYDRVGHLFQGRFHSVPVEDEGGYLKVIRYIMRNPVKAGICMNPADYRWSNYHSLGSDDGVADSRMLMRIVERKYLLEFIDMPEDDGQDPVEEIERCHVSDRDTFEIMKEVSGARTAAEFLQLDEARREECIRLMNRRGCQFVQIRRVLGVSKFQMEKMRGRHNSSNRGHISL